MCPLKYSKSKGFLIQGKINTFLETRRGITQGWKQLGLSRGYDNALYGIWSGRENLWLLTRGSEGKNDAAKAAWEESQHFGYGDEVGHVEKGERLKTYKDFKRLVFHDRVFNKKLGIVAGWADIYLLKMKLLAKKEAVSYQKQCEATFLQLLEALKIALDRHPEFIPKLLRIHDKLRADLGKVTIIEAPRIRDKAYAEANNYIATLLIPVFNSIEHKAIEKDYDPLCVYLHREVLGTVFNEKDTLQYHPELISQVRQYLVPAMSSPNSGVDC